MIPVYLKVEILIFVVVYIVDVRKGNKLKIGSLIVRQHINESRLRVLLELIK